MSDQGERTVSEEMDLLTGVMTRQSAEEQIRRVLQRDTGKERHLVLLHLWNMNRFVEEYGTAFAMAMIQNYAIIMRKYFGSFGEETILGRMQKDTFLVFLRCQDAHAVEQQAALVYEKLKSTYFGRSRSLEPQLTIALCHLGEEVQTLSDALRPAGCAMECSRVSGKPVVIYEPALSEEYEPYPLSELYSGLEGENLARYDMEFVSFAVSLMSNSRNLDSGVDMLLLRIGHRFRFDEALVSEFEGNGRVCMTNKWTREQGVLEEMDEVVSLDEWDGFLSGFDENGISFVPDITKHSFSDKDREFFEEKKIMGFFNILLYSNERPIGYLSCSCRDRRREWEEGPTNSLIQLGRLLASFVSLRMQKKKDRQRIEYLSRDELTGAYLYKAFKRKVAQLLSEFDESKAYAVAYSDISNFSLLNETFGFEEGNHVLREFARRILAGNEANVFVCRLEGDRFVVFSFRDERSAIEERVKRVNDEFAEYLAKKYPQSDFHITSGIFFLDSPNLPLYTMIDAANHARKSVKRQHHDSIGIYTSDLWEQRNRIQDVIGSIHDAISSGEIEAFLQPKFSMSSRTVIGAEALVRWRKEDGTYRYPDQFIPVLEESGFIVDVDMCVYEQVLRLLAQWKQQGRSLIPISVNFSRVHFRNQDAYQKIIRLAEQYGIDPRYIEVEITESVFSSDRANLYSQMSHLRQHGFKIDIDDFGTGYSSLNMLLFAPVDNVKVDKSFIDRYETKDEKEYINQIGNLVLSAKKTIIFEGVETEEQVVLLTGYGYDWAQGYLFSKPVPMQEFEKLMDHSM